MEPATTEAARDLWLAPPLVDLQVNGFAGVDFQQDNLTGHELIRAIRALRQAGCSQFFVTLITDDWPAMLARLRHLRSLCRENAELRAAVVGWHLEGPFLSSAPGFCGAHAPELMIDPTPECIRQIRAATEAEPVLVTLAPERRNAIDCIALARSLGLKVSLGHTNASAEVLRSAVEAGATGFTHLGNACPQELDRHDNILWRALDLPGLTVSLIPDGMHVSPPLFRLAHRLLPPNALFYTTDAVAAAGAPAGRYTVGRHQVDVGPDQVVRQPGKSNFAGSGLRPMDGVLRATEMLRRPWQEVWPFYSLHPSRFMGIYKELGVGEPANFCLVREGVDGQITDVRTFAAGAEPGEWSPPTRS